MGRRRSTEAKQPKRKAVKVRLCQRLNAGQVTEPYRIMESVIDQKRSDLKDVKVGIAWHKGWRPDSDGVRTHGKCVKRSELDRAMDSFDFMIVLSETSWQAFDDAGKERLIYHELEHAQVCVDKSGEPMFDDKDRIVTRIKRHDVADFSCVIERYGLPPALRDMAEMNDAERPLLALAEKKTSATPDAQRRCGGATEGTEEKSGIEAIVVRFTGLKLVSCTIDLRQDSKGWWLGYSVRLGNYTQESPLAECTDPLPTQAKCLLATRGCIIDWLASLPNNGKADQKRAFAARVESMREQVTAALDEKIRGGVVLDDDEEDADEVLFEEDAGPAV
jgi:hypothetical protein